MRKRIGTKLYDTDKGILVLPEINLYRQPLGRSFYYFNGEKITPVPYEEAEKMITESGNETAIASLYRKPNNDGDTHVAISAASADRLSAYCRRHKTSQKKVVEELIDTLPDD